MNGEEETVEHEYLIVSSITYALKSKSLLEARGIAASVEKIKNVKALGGCGYGVRVRSVMADAAAKILAANGIHVVQRDSG